ncbi:MAG: TRAM domain-containing protein [Clostridiales bacterium]|nr:TRAM domain-containing protein [Clostridiales bacterium]
MGKKLLRPLITLFGLILGFGIVWAVYKNQNELGLASFFANSPSWMRTVLYALFSVVFGVIFFFIAPGIIKGVVKLTKRVEGKTSEMSMQQIFVGVIGLLLGLVIAALISLLIQKIPFTAIRLLLNVIVFAVLAYLGWKIPTSRIREFNLPNWFRRGDNTPQADPVKAKPKVLDTSSIIDGRFFDVYKTGIIEGAVIVPSFVLDELRHIADSADPLKRARGRRGLDLINKMMDGNPDSVTVSDTDYADLAEVDTKLLRLAQDLNGIVVTNDYNLGKVAAVQSVPVFNINDLANSLRINVVAGEVVEVTVVKEGKEHGQGVAYFDDGTMVVIDGANRLVGETIPVTVTSVLQTSAGRMVFAKLEE